MFKVNDNYLKLPGSYLFSTIGKKVSAYSAAHLDKKIIRLGIGDVTQPLAPAIIDALHGAVDEMGKAETFHGYAPDLGYEFLRNAIAENDYKARGCDIAPDEIFVSDGAKCDCGNIQEIFSLDNKIAVCDPVYPVYVDSNVMAGRTGTYDPKSETWSDVIYMPCLAENGFAPELPKETPDLIYLCFPNNPTGAAITKAQLQEWVDYANKVGAVILYDAAYEAYISEPDVPHSIYECEGARTCAIEFRSFSKQGGFTGVRCGYVVIPKELHGYDSEGNKVSISRLWSRRTSTKFNGASYIVQRGAAALFTMEGMAQTAALISHYLGNASLLLNACRQAGMRVWGGENAPYVWVQCPDGLDSWQMFDKMLHEANVVITPGSGFGSRGEGFFLISAFNSRENVDEVCRRIHSLFAR